MSRSGSKSATNEGEADSEVVYNWASLSTICGVPHIAAYRRSSLVQLFYIFVFVVFCGLTIHDTVMVLMDYYTYPTITSFALRHSATVDFPGVTVCNFNPVRRSKVDLGGDRLQSFLDYVEGMARELEEGYGGGVAGGLPGLPPPTTAEPAPDFDADWTYLLPPHIQDMYEGGGETEWMEEERYGEYDDEAGGSKAPDWDGYGPPDDDEMYFVKDEQYTEKLQKSVDKYAVAKQVFKALVTDQSYPTRKKMGHQPRDFIHECSFKGVKCSTKNFRWVMSPDYGNCFTFNFKQKPSSTPYTVTSPGPLYGLSLTLYVDQPDYMEFTETAGAKVVVHQFGTQPFPFETGISLFTGAETNIAITQQSISRLGAPYGTCETGDVFKQDTGYLYSTLTCLDQCVQKFVIDKCECQTFMLNTVNRNKKQCQTEQERKCSHKERQTVLRENSCSKTCNPPCKETAYQHDLSAASWPSRKYQEIFIMTLKHRMANLSESIGAFVEREIEQYELAEIDSNTGRREFPDNLKKELVKVNIYFKELNFNNITESPSYDYYKLLGDLGGVLGIYIGICAFSLVELLHLVVYYIANKCCNSKAFRLSEMSSNKRKEVAPTVHPQLQYRKPNPGRVNTLY